jgi:hypothetical protein
MGVFGFTLVAGIHQPEQDKRWVLVAPPSSSENAATPSAAAFLVNCLARSGGSAFLC